MALSCVTTKIVLTLPLFVILLITPLSSSISPTDKVTKEILKNLCSNPSVYKNFCIVWLESDPKTFTVDINGLLGLVIEKTYLLGLKNIEKTKDLARTTTEPTLKFDYGYRMIHYELAIKALEAAKDSAISKDYKLAASASFKALDNISSCEAQLEQKANVPAYLSKSNYFFDRMCGIAQAFSYVLLG